jgi:hypothetical protein
MNLTLSIIVFFFVLLITGNAYSELEPSLGFYMTNGESTESKDTFRWDETPFAFIQFDVDDLNNEKPLILWWKWRYENSPWIFFEWEDTINFPEDKIQVRNSPDNWDFEKLAGKWTVQTTWRNPGSGGGMSKTAFTVTSPVVPEPISSLLFVIGGAFLTGKHFIKRKRN